MTSENNENMIVEKQKSPSHIETNKTIACYYDIIKPLSLKKFSDIDNYRIHASASHRLKGKAKVNQSLQEDRNKKLKEMVDR